MFNKLFRYFFINKTTNQTLFKNTSWLLVSNVFVRFLKFFLIPYSSLILGIVQFGSFYYFLALSSSFYLFSDIGLSAYLGREYNQKKLNGDKLTTLVTFFYTKSISIFICFSFSLSLLVLYFDTPLFKVIILMILIAFADNYKKIFVSILNTKQKNEIYSIISVISSLLLVTGGLLVLKFTQSFFYYTAVFLFSNALELVCLLLVFRKEFPSFRLFKRETSLTMLKQSFPFMLTGIISMLLNFSDTLIIKWIRGFEMVAFYQAPLRIIGVASIFYISFGNALYPILCQYSSDRKSFIKIAKNGLSLSFLVGLPIFVGGTILSKNIIELLFTKTYNQSINVLRVFLFILFITFLLSIINSALVAVKKEVANAKISFISAGINIILSLVFIVNFGVIGVAIATLIARLFDLCSSLIVLYKIIKSNLFDVNVVIKSFMSCGIMASGLYLLIQVSNNLVLLVLFGTVLYSVSLLVLKEKYSFYFFSKVKGQVKEVLRDTF
jgi:O-antigen/teichoic acid export membrane protein